MKMMSDKETDDLDLMLTLCPNGWSTFWLVSKNQKIEIVISHAFSDPFYDLTSSLRLLIEGNKNASFIWYDEPGGAQFVFTQDDKFHHIIEVEISEFTESYGEHISQFKEVYTFRIKKNMLIILFYNQLKKTQLLLKEKSYAKNRRSEFPLKEFLELEKELKRYKGILTFPTNN